MDFGDGRSNVQDLTEKAGRICTYFSYPSSEGPTSLTYHILARGDRDHIAQALADGIFSDEILPIGLRGAVVSSPL